MTCFLLLLLNIVQVCFESECKAVDGDVNDWFVSFNSHLKHDQLNQLPTDDSVHPDLNRTPRQVLKGVFTRVTPTSINSPKLISYSPTTFSQLLDVSFPSNSEEQILDILTQIASGDSSFMKEYLPNSTPYAHNYAGHQFGYFSGQLGDGRAIALGEYHTNDGKIWELQLKGAGKTPFSRRGDGRAVLRSSIREYLMSEFMHNLNIPSSRAAMLVTSTSEKIRRDMFYNGNIREEAVAIVLRLSPNWIRFGSFELGISNAINQQLLDYVIERHYNKIWIKYENDDKLYERWWLLLIRKNAFLVMKWMTVGFVHGVLNTDNLSILGIGIDYGPFGMMEYFDQDFVPNYSDDEGRYAFSKQADIFKWNLNKLAEALSASNILDLKVSQKHLNEQFDAIYDDLYLHEMKKKFGLMYYSNIESLRLLADAFFNVLRLSVCDMTNSFRNLNMISVHGINQCFAENGHCTDVTDMNRMKMYEEREDDKFIEYILDQCVTPSHYRSLQRRKYMIKTHDYGTYDLFKKDNSLANMNIAEKRNYDEQNWRDFLKLFRTYLNKEWEATSRDIDMKKWSDDRVDLMDFVNPKYILRNYMFERAIKMAESGDYSEIEQLKSMISDPFTQNPIFDGYDQAAPERSCDSFESCDLLSCSS